MIHNRRSEPIRHGQLKRPTRMTAAEYLAFEEASSHRHEFVDGMVYPMADEWIVERSDRHSLIKLNSAAALSSALPDDFLVFDGSVRIEMHSANLGWTLYPDILICRAGDDRQPGVCTRPLLAIDVLTSDTERQERYEHREAYRNLPTMNEYVLIQDHTLAIEHYRRKNDWRMECITAGRLRIETFDLELTTKQIYRRVTL